MTIENLNENIDKNIDRQVEQSIELLNEVFEEDLLGVYLYGSAVMGGLQKYSDIDLFVIVARPTTLEDKIKLAERLVKISGVYSSVEKRPIEMTIVVQSEVNPWHYPPNFDFQYGDWLRTEFESGNSEPWQTKAMPGLSLMMTQLLLSSKTLQGDNPASLLEKVPYQDFVTALTSELDTVRADLLWDTRNVLLTLARIWWTIETDSITSKQKAGQGAVERLPETYKPVMQRALGASSGTQEETWDDLGDTVLRCADFMVDEIQKKMTRIVDSADDTSHIISLA